MISTETGIENLTLNITQEIHVRASLEVTFAALLEQLGPENETPEGKMPMKIEAWPGGRWYPRSGRRQRTFLGKRAGYQAGRRCLRSTGPLFMSYPVVSNLQYRLSEEDGGTLIKFHHKALGLIQDDHRQGVGKGWTHMHARIKERAEANVRN